MSAWIVSHALINQLVYGAIRVEVIHPDAAQETGAMLKRANLKSIRARYGPEDRQAAEAAKERYFYREPLRPMTLVALRKQVNHYDYQTCEFSGYPKSRAGSFVNSMLRQLEKHGAGPEVQNTAEYQTAPWGI